MLKLTYIETGFHLEQLAQSLEEWVTLRVILALRVGESICVEPSTASFLLPADLPGLDVLQTAATGQEKDVVTFCTCDAECVEVSLEGTWLSSDSEVEEGVFVTALSHSTEFFLFKLWQETQVSSSVMSE